MLGIAFSLSRVCSKSIRQISSQLWFNRAVKLPDTPTNLSYIFIRRHKYTSEYILKMTDQCNTNAATAKFNVIFVLGGPGAGKGTQCANIVKEYGYVHLSAGELLREEMNSRGGEFYEEINKHMKAGSIVPVKITCGLLERAMNQHKTDHGKLNFLIDGFPRNTDNLEGWEEQMSSKCNVQAVMYIKCDDDTCVARCKERGKDSQRVDDNEETLRRRLVQFQTQCQPIIEIYRSKNLVREIDGSLPPDEVFNQVKLVFADLSRGDCS